MSSTSLGKNPNTERYAGVEAAFWRNWASRGSQQELSVPACDASLECSHKETVAPKILNQDEDSVLE